MGEREAKKAVEEYRRRAIQTAQPVELISMLYDALIHHCESAIRCMGEKNLEGQHSHFAKAQKILAELMSSLELQKGGEIAKNLFNIYAFCMRELSEANIKDDARKAVNCVGLLKELQEAWREVRRYQERLHDKHQRES
ncbi:MAG TPA: flagellar export chaperone FliS [Fimbriimonadales bacterium]|nr:flagellar export chaperone FliS [Fimbriimonadales bacterium]